LSNKGKRRNLIVPIFIPNQGCPHRCIFCQQEKITGQSSAAEDIRPLIKDTLDRAIASPRFDLSNRGEVAFYGGTFTRLPKRKITELLNAVTPYLRNNLFRSIRVSTRPDELDEERLDLMAGLGVSTVELGVQSMDDEVLRLSQRGHSAHDTVQSVQLLRKHGFRVGIQLMPGLPGDSEEKFCETVEAVIDLHPDMVRLYPTVVISGTELARWYEEKRYRPLQLNRAIIICQESCFRLESQGIPVIRIGLMSSPSLLREDQIVAGPWHRAFGFLVRSSMHQKSIEPYLPKPGQFKKITIKAPYREIPLVRGYKNRGLSLIENKIGAEIMHVIPDESVPYGQIGFEKI
jgi:histone acetyltransferase (RNA polymerase elongator complex component)